MRKQLFCYAEITRRVCLNVCSYRSGWDRCRCVWTELRCLWTYRIVVSGGIVCRPWYALRRDVSGWFRCWHNMMSVLDIVTYDYTWVYTRMKQYAVELNIIFLTIFCFCWYWKNNEGTASSWVIVWEAGNSCQGNILFNIIQMFMKTKLQVAIELDTSAIEWLHRVH